MDATTTNTASWKDQVRAAIGPGYSEKDLDELARLAYSHLEMTVGTRLADGLTPEQLADFDRLTAARDEEGIRRWLEATCPDYPATVDEERLRLLARLEAARG